MINSKRRKLKVFSSFFGIVCSLSMICGLFWMQGCFSNSIKQNQSEQQGQQRTFQQPSLRNGTESTNMEPSKQNLDPGQVNPEGEEGYIDDSFGARLAKMEIPEQFRLQEIVVGDPKAPKTLTVYFSYTCPHCREFHLNEFPKFKREFVDKGLVKVIFRNYLDDQGAYEAALVVRCSCKDDPQEYHKLSEKIIEKQKEWLSSENPAVFLVKIFEGAGIGEEKIKECLKRTDIGAGLMLEQKRAMWDLKLFSMPAFINDKGEQHIGSITYEELLKLCGCEAQ